MSNLKNESFYQRLTRLFRTGPAIKQKIKGQDPKAFYDKSIVQNNLGYYGATAFKREASPFSVMGAYGLLDRMSRYAEFQEMEYTTEIASALDIYADESCASDEDGKCLHIYTDNKQIRNALEELFYEIANVELDMRRWVRNLVKYGDFFLYNEVIPDQGVVHVEPIPVNVIEREEAYDPSDPYAVRFKLLTHGGKILENWQVTHFRLQGNELFHPYGSSFLESARRTWRQLVMLEDAMLVYRVVRSPERRVFYIDVSGIHPNDVPTYMETVTQTIKGNDVIDKMNGRMDLRYNAIDVNEDYFLPTRPNNLTKIDTLAGGQHVSATEDVEYIQKKLFAALKVPRAYLTYDESLSSKATLSQEDIRFSRTIATLQKVILAELSKLAIIHLFAKGFEGEDLLDFELKLSNPSTIAVQQKLQLLTTRLDAAAKAQEMAKESTIFSEEWIQKEIMKFRMDQILEIRKQRFEEQQRVLRLQKTVLEDTNQKTITDPFDPSNYKKIAGAPVSSETENEITGTIDKEMEMNSSGPEPGKNYNSSIDKSKAPIRANATPNLDNAARKRERSKEFSGNRALGMPDVNKMLSVDNRYTKDPYDMKSLLELEINDHGVKKRTLPNVSKDVQSTLNKFHEHFIKKHQMIDIEFINEEGTTISEDSVLTLEDLAECFEKQGE